MRNLAFVLNWLPDSNIIAKSTAWTGASVEIVKGKMK